MGIHPTIKDVAKKAGVSITTVSFVLNRRTDVVISEEVKKRVLAVAQELDYHPSAMAAGLAGRRTKNLGVVFYLEDKIISNQFYSFVIEGIVKEAMDKDFNLLFSYMESTYEGKASLPKIVRAKNVDGVLLIGRTEPRMVYDLQEKGLALVAIDNFPGLKAVDTIHADNRQGGMLAVEHLAQLGHKHIGHLTIAKGRPSIEQRREGWAAGMAKVGLDASAGLVLEAGALSFPAGLERTKEALKRNKKLTAVFCANDEMAAGAIRAAHELGRSVPGDLSVVGFDNIAMGSYLDPALTTVSPAKEFMGKMAVTRLLELMEAKEAAPRAQQVPVELIVRHSTGKP
ncbi:MAG TPA: LacI family DNA-binding transcriptional regulator [bacterium]|nr:LacI family DNA-binding transcriptional regulator [bacterium]